MFKLPRMTGKTSSLKAVVWFLSLGLTGGSAAAAGISTNQERNESEAITTLALDQPIQREISGGVKHVYRIVLTEGQYFRIQMKQLGSAISVWLQQPDASIISIIDLPTRKPEITIERVVDAGGTYLLELRTSAKGPTGHYEIRLGELHQSNQRERDLQRAQVLFEQFMNLQHEGRDLEARTPLLDSLEIRDRVLGADDLLVGDMVSYLANNYMNTGDYASAEPLLERSVQVREKKFGPQSAEVAGALRELAMFHFERGDFLKAEELLQEVLAVFARVGVKDGITTASVLDYLGEINYSRHDYRKAAAYYQRANAVLTKELGADNFHLGFSFTRMGRAAYDSGDFSAAEANFQRALDLAEKGLGPESLRLISFVNDLAMLYCMIGDYPKAEELYQRALSIQQKVGQANPDLRTQFGLARLQAAEGHSFDALRLQAEASEQEERYITLNLAVGSERERIAFHIKLAM